jgi:hypothetical protein
MAECCGYMPKAEIPKEHPRAIDKDHQVHDFQLICSTRFRLSEVSLSVWAGSHIARPLALRELGFILIINDVALSVSLVFVYTIAGPSSFGSHCPLMRGIPGYVTRIAPDRCSGIGPWVGKSSK